MHRRKVLHIQSGGDKTNMEAWRHMDRKLRVDEDGERTKGSKQC